MLKGICIGSAHIDIFAEVSLEESCSNHIDKRGKFYISTGGTACNVAVALAHLGVKTTLITALPKNKLFSELTKFSLKSIKNLEVHYEYIDCEEDAGFLGLRQNGELTFAVNCCPIENYELTLLDFKTIILNSDFVVVDLNCSLQTIKNLLSILGDSSKNKLFISAVSEIKSLKLLEIAPFSSKGIFLNCMEFEFLKKKAQKDILHLIDTTWFITYQNGVVIKNNNYESFVLNNFCYSRKSSSSGCGDAFMAGCIFNIFNENQSFKEAAHNSFVILEPVICNKGAQITDTTKITSDLVYRDSLTGLYQRAFLEEIKDYLNGYAKRNNTVHSVIMIDIDYFKKINDTYGHTTGDQVLKEIGKAIKNSLRQTDFPVRFGGEEFCIVLLNTKAEDAFLVAERLRKKLALQKFQLQVVIQLK